MHQAIACALVATPALAYITTQTLLHLMILMLMLVHCYVESARTRLLLS